MFNENPDDDVIRFEVHEVDLQMIPKAQQDQAMVWKLIDDPAVKKAWDDARDAEIMEMEEYYLKELQLRLLTSTSLPPPVMTTVLTCPSPLFSLAYCVGMDGSRKLPPAICVPGTERSV